MSKYSKVVLKPGMNVTHNPGYYKAGAFGIRIETFLFVVERSYAFENVNITPYNQSLIKQSLLNERVTSPNRRLPRQGVSVVVPSSGWPRDS
jgi:Xaa-Pro aminopeptidase